MSESTDPQAWVLRAEEDYLLCRSALRRKVPLRYGATFHAQQCAEKYLKALGVFANSGRQGTLAGMKRKELTHTPRRVQHQSSLTSSR